MTASEQLNYITELSYSISIVRHNTYFMPLHLWTLWRYTNDVMMMMIIIK